MKKKSNKDKHLLSEKIVGAFIIPKIKELIMMFESVICVLILVVCIISVIVDIKRLKAVRENTKVYKELKEQTINFRNEVRIYVDEQNKNSISFEDLVERLETTMKERLR